MPVRSICSIVCFNFDVSLLILCLDDWSIETEVLKSPLFLYWSLSLPLDLTVFAISIWKFLRCACLCWWLLWLLAELYFYKNKMSFSHFRVFLKGLIYLISKKKSWSFLVSVCLVYHFLAIYFHSIWSFVWWVACRQIKLGLWFLLIQPTLVFSLENLIHLPSILALLH